MALIEIDFIISGVNVWQYYNKQENFARCFWQAVCQQGKFFYQSLFNAAYKNYRCISTFLMTVLSLLSVIFSMYVPAGNSPTEK